jgi:hypothetical protein
MAEIGVAGTGGNDEGIVGDFLSFIVDCGVHHAAFEIEAGDLSHEHFDVVVAAQNRTDRGSDFARRKTGCGYLVEQRLEGVMILAIDDSDLDGCAGERLGCA